MSGIEIAGLVLGAFPLLIYALDQYREGAEALRDWWRIERTFKKCRQDLSYHQLLFEGNVERFLLPLVVDDDELKTLMDDPAGQRWEDPELEQRLKDRLPKAYALFLDIIGDINSLMDSMKKELGVKSIKFQSRVNRDHKLDKADASRRDLMSMANIEFQAKRIKFTVKKSSRERLFAQLQEANDRMRNLLESSDQVTAARRRGEISKPPSTVSRKITEFWRHAKRLHDALATAWQCTCLGHVANLGLEHRLSDKVEFDILFHLGAAHQQHSWQGTRIKMVANANGLSINVPQAPMKLPSAGPGPRQVRWNPAVAQPSIKPDNHMVQIFDLCSVLSSSCPNGFGFLDQDEHRFVFYPEDRMTTNNTPSTVSLEQILHDTQALTRRKRYSLALTLASSYLQLGATPWLNTALRKESIVFLKDPSSQDPQSALLDQPYIRQEITKATSTPATDAISSLGIRLLELCFGAPIEATSFRKQLPAGDDISGPILDYAAAIQWSRLAGEEAGPEFAEAIEWCLHAKEVNDGSWRKDLWQHVIVPLDACHKQVSQKPIFI